MAGFDCQSSDKFKIILRRRRLTDTVRPLIIILLCFSTGCSVNQADKTQDNNETKEKVRDMDALVFDFGERSQRVRYNNTTYDLSTHPFKDSASDIYTVKIVLQKSTDTIFTREVNADTLCNAIIDGMNEMNPVTREVLEQYSLVKVTPTDWARGYNAYLIALFKKEQSRDIYMRFAIKAFTEDHRLWMNQLQYDVIE